MTKPHWALSDPLMIRAGPRKPIAPTRSLVCAVWPPCICIASPRELVDLCSCLFAWRISVAQSKQHIDKPFYQRAGEARGDGQLY